MREILGRAREVLAGGGRAAWVTVLTAEGSAPRGPGASLLAGEQGLLAGTVGGGAAEGAALANARRALAEAKPRVDAFELTPEDAAGLNAACGGRVRLLTQVLCADDLPMILEIAEAARRGGRWLERVWDGDRVSMRLLEEGPDCPEYAPGRFVQPLAAPERAWVYGGGHVARALVPLLTLLDFAPVVLDDRPEFADASRFPGAQARLIRFEADDVPAGADDYVVIMTRGHQFDYEVLRRALRTPARYVGMMGSRQKISGIRARLLEEGFAPDDFDRVHTPIGLAIGARTPQEIAVSIAAEMIAVRAAKDFQRPS